MKKVLVCITGLCCMISLFVVFAINYRPGDYEHASRDVAPNAKRITERIKMCESCHLGSSLP